jgi:hypothetical protein
VDVVVNYNIPTNAKVCLLIFQHSHSYLSTPCLRSCFWSIFSHNYCGALNCIWLFPFFHSWYFPALSSLFCNTRYYFQQISSLNLSLQSWNLASKHSHLHDKHNNSFRWWMTRWSCSWSILHLFTISSFLICLQDYFHRVGRTARAGRSGLAISLVNQFDIGPFKQIEKHIGG